ncbi:unnamed protein product [Cuscuta epithymum]|uniref:Glabrous enhancer-binding protein-like DBD domain-containing protein n=1 Tax=Cuscuta epithymum TaxID=186058 RepID=A0AAV0GBA6_9ASTE|nr:unnamed protein product [Cuscuta epithymum]
MACHNDRVAVVYNEEEDPDEDDDYDETLDPPPNVIDDEDDGDGSTSSSSFGADPIPHSSVHPPAPLSYSKPTITVAGVPSGSFRPDLIRQRTADSVTAAAATTTIFEDKKPSAAVLDESRKLFQRLWTDEDEIELLKGFLEYTAHRAATSSSSHHDTAAFYDQIKSKLQLDFNKSQLVEKLRRLKKKYRTVASKMETGGKEYVFKSTHDQVTFEISRKIWSNNFGSTVRGGGVIAASVEDGGSEDLESNPNHTLPNFAEQQIAIGTDSKSPNTSRKRSRGPSTTPKVEEKQKPLLYQPSSGITTSLATPTTAIPNANASSTAATPLFKAVTLTPVAATTPKITGTSIPGLIEETVKSCLSPTMIGWRGGGMSTVMSQLMLPLGLGSDPLSPEMRMMSDNKWRRQHMLELEVYSRRLELVQDEIKEQLEQLRSMGGGGS